MKQLMLFVFIATTFWSCEKDDRLTNSDLLTDGLTGIAVIEGRIGYFSVPPPPPNSPYRFLYPSGYVLGEYHWMTTDTPKVASRIFLDGDYGEYKYQYVRVNGSWKEIINMQNKQEYRYLVISVDSIHVIQE
jgi:hypothetical protein